MGLFSQDEIITTKPEKQTNPFRKEEEPERLEDVKQVEGRIVEKMNSVIEQKDQELMVLTLARQQLDSDCRTKQAQIIGYQQQIEDLCRELSERKQAELDREEYDALKYEYSILKEKSV